MNQLRFRTRLVLILSLFAIVPALLLTLLWSGTVSTALPFVTGRSAWDSVAASGEKAIAAARQAPLTAAQRRAIDAHERLLADGEGRNFWAGGWLRHQVERLREQTRR